jgi:hypothetical protein
MRKKESEVTIYFSKIETNPLGNILAIVLDY